MGKGGGIGDLFKGAIIGLVIWGVIFLVFDKGLKYLAGKSSPAQKQSLNQALNTV